MNILLVDDDPQRFTFLRSRYGADHDYRERRNPNAVTDDDIAWAEAVSLDHDMCESETLGAPCPRTGEGARCTCPDGVDMTNRLWKQPRRMPVIVHSANIPGGERMFACLRGAEFAVLHYPVTWMAMHGASVVVGWLDKQSVRVQRPGGTPRPWEG